MTTQKLAGALALFAGLASTFAASISIPNGSFESPQVPEGVQALPFMDSWVHAAQPADYNTVNGPWDQNRGVFPNSPANQPGNLSNADGSQIAFFSSEPRNGIYQDLTNSYQTGQSYVLTVGIVGSLFVQLHDGASLSLQLYYRSTGNEIVPVLTTPITYNTTNFPGFSQLYDFSVAISPVKATDPWANKAIGIMISSTSTDTTKGGFWDLDNVRLSAIPASLQVNNYSFETPVVPEGVAALPFMDSWDHAPQPANYDIANGPWEQNRGVFPNSPSGQQGNISNVDQAQAAYFSSEPENAIYQDLTSIYEPGAGYTAIVGVASSFFVRLNAGASVSFELYYRNGTNAIMPIASNPIVYGPDFFPNFTELVDFAVAIPPVKATDPWANKNIGVRILSTSTPTTKGGFWDLDNVRVQSRVGSSLNALLLGQNAQLTWNTAAGVSYQVQISEDLQNWSDLDAPILGTGVETFKVVSVTAHPHAFFRLIATPLSN